MTAMLIISAMVAVFYWALFAATHKEDTDECCSDLFNEEDE